METFISVHPNVIYKLTKLDININKPFESNQQLIKRCSMLREFSL